MHSALIASMVTWLSSSQSYGAGASLCWRLYRLMMLFRGVPGWFGKISCLFGFCAWAFRSVRLCSASRVCIRPWNRREKGLEKPSWLGFLFFVFSTKRLASKRKFNLWRLGLVREQWFDLWVYDRLHAVRRTEFGLQSVICYHPSTHLGWLYLYASINKQAIPALLFPTYLLLP